ncbi:hypothetical protein F503_04436 [Ophiostoma piceae UAMH 11346]|uniref:Uncharacterized protein n=1 Tax=Ophiostoma piceae (strain UAMH 11346) TaxID=1262450 RepID=S3C5P9_OPHP1|nr:hypothetical protein F503_04436 [Ophiostoma piceae UAMH 11346]
MASSTSAADEKARVQEHLNRVSARDNEKNHQDENIYSESLIGAESTDDEEGPAAGPSRPRADHGDHGDHAGRAVDDDHAPPMYSGPASPAQEAALVSQGGSAAAAAAAAAAKRGPPRYPGLLHLDYRLYAPPLFELSEDKTTIKSNASYLSSTVSALANLVREQATVPPKPIIHITGQRGRKVDFSVKINLMNLLVSDDLRRRMNYVRCVGRNELAMRGGSSKTPSVVPDIESSDAASAIDQWCLQYVNDPASVKVFVLERQVANMDINWLEGQVRSLVASTGYKGAVTVKFPVTHARVVVQSPDKVNKFFTSVTTLFTGKSTYEVVKSVWPFATHKSGEPGRKYAVQSEQTWWKEWRDPIRYAISMKRVGWVTNEDKLEVLMEGVGKGITVIEWGSEHT